MKRILIAIGLLFSSPAFAVVTANSIISPQTPNRAIVQFLQGTDNAGIANAKVLYTAGSNGSVCSGIQESNNDAGVATGHLLNLQIVNGGIFYAGAAIQTTPSAGFIAQPGPVVGTGLPNDVITGSQAFPGVWKGLPVDSLGNYVVQLASGDTLKAYYTTALTASAVINLYAVCNDF